MASNPKIITPKSMANEAIEAATSAARQTTEAAGATAQAGAVAAERAFGGAETRLGAVPRLEVPAVVRDIAERGVQQAKSTYEQLRSTAEQTTDLVEESYSATSKGLTELSLKVLEAARANANAQFDLASELLGVRSASQAIELQTAHARRQFETLSTQARELTSIASRVLSDSAKPYRVLAERAVKIAQPGA